MFALPSEEQDLIHYLFKTKNHFERQKMVFPLPQSPPGVSPGSQEPSLQKTILSVRKWFFHCFRAPQESVQGPRSFNFIQPCEVESILSKTGSSNKTSDLLLRRRLKFTRNRMGLITHTPQVTADLINRDFNFIILSFSFCCAAFKQSPQILYSELFSFCR